MLRKNCTPSWFYLHPLCVPDSHPYRVTNTRRRIGTVFSPDDGHIVPETCREKQ